MKRLFPIVLLSLGFGLAQGAYKLRVTSWSCTYTGGAWVAQGVVENTAGRTLQGIRVHLRVVEGGLDRLGGVSPQQVYGTNSAPIARGSLPPGESSRFSVRVPTSRREAACQIWFRNPSVVQIPTQVPRL
ncbi:hypothetical protein DV704_06240 [Meiothermus sp. QL-1]|uniref:hypothetical protein n=1 Tax=Meiothermus sp. QL-1 TaxID=2058095 RepID=UPI000E0A465A|nr:hypothetical protein [Meiothermus sp. QL-1]RDI95480.1 hypothetical protein DV704_06240 [Meiothermus sp. QL-1]